MNEQATHQLFLLRHAKSSWTDPSLSDHDRPLAPRGIKAAASMKKYLRKSHIEPRVVLSSSANRAIQTLEGVRAALPPGAEVRIEEELYGTNAETLLERLRRLPEQLRSVLVVNHSPAIEGLAVGLARDTNDEALQRMRLKYPTGGLAALSFRGRWSELSWGMAILDQFVIPKDLE
jgi:phosphohistidine phosphatase